jgi:superoxide dismutase
VIFTNTDKLNNLAAPCDFLYRSFLMPFHDEINAIKSDQAMLYQREAAPVAPKQAANLAGSGPKSPGISRLAMLGHSMANRRFVQAGVFQVQQIKANGELSYKVPSWGALHLAFGQAFSERVIEYYYREQCCCLVTFETILRQNNLSDIYTLHDVQAATSTLTPAVAACLHNNSVGHWSFQFFWGSLLNGSVFQANPSDHSAAALLKHQDHQRMPHGVFLQVLLQNFGSLSALRNQLFVAAINGAQVVSDDSCSEVQFHSQQNKWLWLVFDHHKLIVMCGNQDQLPLLDNKNPILCLPIVPLSSKNYQPNNFEQYVNHLNRWWEAIDWARASEQYAAALHRTQQKGSFLGSTSKIVFSSPI